MTPDGKKYLDIVDRQLIKLELMKMQIALISNDDNNELVEELLNVAANSLGALTLTAETSKQLIINYEALLEDQIKDN